MNELWHSCATVIKESITKGNIDATDIKAIGISAQGKGAFLLDKQLKPLGNAILSSDQRSNDIVKNWYAEGLPQKIYPLTSQSIWAGHPVSILRWLKENEYHRYERIGAILMSHDYLRYCFTGEIHCEITNISESNLYNIQSQSYDLNLAKLFGIEEIFPYLPSIINSNDIAGYVNEEAAYLSGLAVNTPVVGGLFDVVSATLCANLSSEYMLNAIFGTWTIVSGITKTRQNNIQNLIYSSYDNGKKYIIHDDSPTSIANLEWFLSQWEEFNYEQINTMLSQLPPASNSILFLPFLYGSNVKLDMQGGLYGLQSYHTKAQVFQAIYEGVIFSFMYHLNRMKTLFSKVDTLRVMGGITHSQVWLQMLADISGHTLEVLDIEEAGCMGAAIIAMQGVGTTTEHIINKLHLNKQIIVPNQQNHILYQSKFNRYTQLTECLIKLK